MVILQYELPQGFFLDGDIVAYRQIAATLPPKARCAEVGVWRGKSTFSIADILRDKDARIFAVDTWGRGGECVERDEGIAVHGEFCDRVRKYRLNHVISMICLDSLDAAKLFEDEAFDMAFLDRGDHTYEGTRDDIAAWWPKVKKGGILAGHDIGCTFPGVDRAVAEKFQNGQVTRFQQSTVWAVRKGS